MATTSLPSITTDTLQRAVTESPEGPVIILGGPGTGKTHSMLGRIAALLKGNASPHTITYLTFSSRGAEDMRRLLHNHPEPKRLRTTSSPGPSITTPATSSDRPEPAAWHLSPLHHLGPRASDGGDDRTHRRQPRG